MGREEADQPWTCAQGSGTDGNTNKSAGEDLQPEEHVESEHRSDSGVEENGDEGRHSRRGEVLQIDSQAQQLPQSSHSS